MWWWQRNRGEPKKKKRVVSFDGMQRGLEEEARLEKQEEERKQRQAESVKRKAFQRTLALLNRNPRYRSFCREEAEVQKACEALAKALKRWNTNWGTELGIFGSHQHDHFYGHTFTAHSRDAQIEALDPNDEHPDIEKLADTFVQKGCVWQFGMTIVHCTCVEPCDELSAFLPDGNIAEVNFSLHYCHTEEGDSEGVIRLTLARRFIEANCRRPSFQTTPWEQAYERRVTDLPGLLFLLAKVIQANDPFFPFPQQELA